MKYLSVQICIIFLIFTFAFAQTGAKTSNPDASWSDYSVKACCPQGYNEVGNFCVKCAAPLFFDPIDNKCRPCP